MSENFPAMSGKARFLEVYTRELRYQVEHDPGKYFYGVDKVPGVAAKMVENLGLKMAHVNTPTIRATCKTLGIRCTQRAIANFIRHGGKGVS